MSIKREDISHARYWVDLFTWGSWEDTDLDNIVKNKNNMGLFADIFNFISPYNITNEDDVNFTISESASDWIQHYVKEKMPDYLNKYINKK